GANLTAESESYGAAITRYGREHLWMVALSMLAAIVVAIPLGVIAARNEAIAQVVLATVGIIQTVPSIALLVLLIAPIGAVARSIGMTDTLGFPQAVVALFLYSLLPIVRNTYTGLRNVPGPLRDSAIALGLSRFRRLWHIELPLASRTILAGVKTAVVINIGFATLGGFIGAGGFGDAIFTGIRRQDTTMVIWEGAIPAAALAIGAQLLFEWVERLIVPRGLRIAARSSD
ncbi:MAG: ABC transporter permease, partial [Phycisphaerales bacterium]|nr:ABC transporter permease [Phycisphaerales bacterium]